MVKWDDHVARRLCCMLVFIALTSTRSAMCFLTSTSRPSLVVVRWRHGEPAARSALTSSSLHCRRRSLFLPSLSSSGEVLPSWCSPKGCRRGGNGATAAGFETREGDGAASAAAAAASDRRADGHSSGSGNPTVSPAAREEGGDRVGSSGPGMLSRGMAATGRFFASDSRRKPSGRRESSDKLAGGIVNKRGGTAAVAAAAAAAAAKLEGEEAAREKEGLRIVPRHVAFVMDGNGRWAAERNKPRRAGHVEGARRAGEAVEACRQLGVECVTLYAFSTENWNRPAGEVSFLMDLMEKTLLEQRDGLRRNGIRLTAIGELHRLPPRLRSLLLEIQRDGTGRIDSGGAGGAGAGSGTPDGPPSIAIPAVGTAEEEVEGAPRNGSPGVRGGGASPSSPRNNRGGGGGGGGAGAPTSPPPTTTTPTSTTTPPPAAAKMTLCLAISYGGRSELAAACRELAAEAAAGELDPADIDEAALARRLSTARLGLPDPDLVVRTSGESRLSNLLVWQSAYAELHVVGKAWPDFRRADLVEAFRDFGRRRRRYGKTPEQIAEAEIEA